MSKRPNFLFLFSDQHRGDWMPYDEAVKHRLGVDDLTLEMPNIRAIMERGTTFLGAISPAPICAPARACLASGQRYKKCRVFTNQVNYDCSLETFCSRLRDSGYYVCGVGKFDLNKADLSWGDGYHSTMKGAGFSFTADNEGKMDTVWAYARGRPGPYGEMLQKAGWIEQYKNDMLQRGHSDRPCPLPDELYGDNWVTENGVKMLMDIPKGEPWFMQVNFSGPHDPWDITETMKERMAGRVFPDAVDCPFTGENQGVRQNYAAMIENIDRKIGLLLEALKERGELEDTIVIYSSDHGEMMGDHGMYGKAKPEQGSIHIPLVIDASHFGGASGLINESPVELQDLAATFLDYAQLPVPTGKGSVSLRPILEKQADRVRDHAMSELVNFSPRGPATSFCVITDGRYKLTLKGGQEAQLFDLPTDPFECNNIAKDLPELTEALRREILKQQERNPIIEQYAKLFPIST